MYEYDFAAAYLDTSLLLLLLTGMQIWKIALDDKGYDFEAFESPGTKTLRYPLVRVNITFDSCLPLVINNLHQLVCCVAQLWMMYIRQVIYSFINSLKSGYK